MQNILTRAFVQRVAQIAKGIDYTTENPDLIYDLIKSATAQQKTKVKRVMDEWKAGTLKSSAGGKVTDYKQALAISLSEAGLHKGGDAREVYQKKKGLCEHGNKIGKCELCNNDELNKDMEMGSGDADGYAASVEKTHTKKIKKSKESDLEKAIENLFGIQDPMEKAFSDILNKGGKGSNKAGRCIGVTRTGKNVHVFKEANDYGDFEPVDHLEAHKIHLHHAAKVTGVAAVNSRIRAHDHEDLARIKAAKKEQEANEKLNTEAEKVANGGNVKKNNTGDTKGKKTVKVQKALADFLNKDEVNAAFANVLQKGEISSTMTSYNDKQPMIFRKSGKEISAKLLAQAGVLAKQEATYTAQMETLEEEIGTPPNDANTSYNNRKILAPRYGYDFYTPKAEVPGYGMQYMDRDKYTDEQTNCYKCCQQYNDLSYKLVNTLEDLDSIRLITENIEPNKKYPLSVGQLTSLGF